MKRPPKALETLLWVNELKEAKAREEFQKAKWALKELEDLLKEVSTRPKKLYDELSNRTLTGEELRTFAQIVDHLFQEKEKVEKILAQKEREVERLRREAVRLHQRRRMAEILCQRARHHYLRELAKEELKNLEDLILMRRKDHENL